MQLTFEDKLILSCIKIHPTSNELDQINNLILQIQDWDYLTTTIIDRGIGPLLYKKLTLFTNSSQIPEVVKSKLQQSYYKTFSRSTILYEHFRKVAEAFSLQKIPVIALKGIYLTEWLYQDIGLRQFSDIDLLVKEEDGLRCLAILTELGYNPIESKETKFVKGKKEIIHYAPMVLDCISIEIHIKLHWKTEKYHLDIEEIWKNAIPVKVNNTPVYALNSNDLLIHLCIHLDKHFRGGHIQFTCFNDITNLLDKLEEIFDWNSITEACQLFNCENIVFRYIVLVKKYMYATVPNDIIQRYSSLLTNEDEELFLKYLSGYSNNGLGIQVPNHIKNLKNIKSFSDKFHYVWDYIFPPKAFILQKYKDQLIISNEQLIFKRSVIRMPWWLMYPFHWCVGVKGILKLIVHSNR